MSDIIVQEDRIVAQEVKKSRLDDNPLLSEDERQGLLLETRRPAPPYRDRLTDAARFWIYTRTEAY